MRKGKDFPWHVCAYTIVSQAIASAHSQVSAQVLVLAAWMKSAPSQVSAQARSLQSRVASAQAASAHKGCYQT